MIKQFVITWSGGYASLTEPQKSALKGVEFFTAENGFTKRDREHINRLWIGDTMTVEEMGGEVTVIRTHNAPEPELSEEELRNRQIKQVGDFFEANGFNEENTGGNCWVWSRHFSNGHYVFISDADGDQPEHLNQTFHGTLYAHPEDFEGLFSFEILPADLPALIKTWEAVK